MKNLYKGRNYYKSDQMNEEEASMYDIIIKIVFLTAGALGISSFFATISNSEIVAIISGIIGIIGIIVTAYLYRKKIGKTIMR